MRKYLTLILLFCLAGGFRASALGNDNDGFIEIDAHALVGGSYVTENYMSCFKEISDLNTNMGMQLGVGVGVSFELKPWLRLNTELNFTRSSGSLDMAVTGSQNASISNVFQRNTYWGVDVPVYISWVHTISNRVKWNLDGGIYIAYGTGGKQKNSIYDAKTNELGQLMTTHTRVETGYYGDDAFITPMQRTDFGLHFATGLTFLEHLKLGVRTHLGLRDVTRPVGLANPNCHNISFAFTAGWVL